MSYTRGLLREAMRLYPVAPFLTRLMPNTALQVKHCSRHLFFLFISIILFSISLGNTRCPLVPSYSCPPTRWRWTQLFSTNQTLSYQVQSADANEVWCLCYYSICPERWERGSDGESRARQAFATLPFGHGPRGCIGGLD